MNAPIITFKPDKKNIVYFSSAVMLIFQSISALSLTPYLNGTVSTDHRINGIKQTKSEGVLSLASGIDFSSGVYASVTGYQAPNQLRPFREAGYQLSLGNFVERRNEDLFKALEFGVSRYGYIGKWQNDWDHNAAYFTAYLNRELGVTLTATNNYYGSDQSAFYFNLNWQPQITEVLSQFGIHNNWLSDNWFAKFSTYTTYISQSQGANNYTGQTDSQSQLAGDSNQVDGSNIESFNTLELGLEYQFELGAINLLAFIHDDNAEAAFQTQASGQDWKIRITMPIY